MSTLRITDEMFLSLRKQCDGDFIENVINGVEIITSILNIWDISDYFGDGYPNARNEDKANFIICFLEKGGTISYEGFHIRKESISNFLSYLYSRGYITNDEMTDISLKWTDCTYGEPYLRLQNNEQPK